MAIKTYLDTNVFFIGLTNMQTNSNLILGNIDLIDPILCQYLIDECLEVFRREKGKEWAALARDFMVNLDYTFIEDEKLVSLGDKYRNYVDDEDDLPHICAYFASGAERFVTTNRRLTKMKVKEFVNFASPKEFAEGVLGMKSLDTQDGI